MFRILRTKLSDAHEKNEGHMPDSCALNHKIIPSIFFTNVITDIRYAVRQSKNAEKNIRKNIEKNYEIKYQKTNSDFFNISLNIFVHFSI